jgi:hypothetical protein
MVTISSPYTSSITSTDNASPDIRSFRDAIAKGKEEEVLSDGQSPTKELSEEEWQERGSGAETRAVFGIVLPPLYQSFSNKNSSQGLQENKNKLCSLLCPWTNGSSLPNV